MWTVGYSGHTPESFIELVQSANLACVVDVRSVPFSRKPGFSKRALSESLRSAGVGYEHVGELGAPRELLDQKKAGSSFSDLAKSYRVSIARKGPAIDGLADLVRSQRCALMCLEKDAADCHRGILAQELGKRGFRVVHL